jgi:hypothetical protein|tara:strand:+ start:968 stop:1246 length:279 start_codon:yes stop_codon:yes gene_type:complete
MMNEDELIASVQDAITRFMEDLDGDDESIDARIFHGLGYNDPDELLSSLKRAVDGERLSHGTVIALLFFSHQVIVSLKSLDRVGFGREDTIH